MAGLIWSDRAPVETAYRSECVPRHPKQIYTAASTYRNLAEEVLWSFTRVKVALLLN